MGWNLFLKGQKKILWLPQESKEIQLFKKQKKKRKKKKCKACSSCSGRWGSRGLLKFYQKQEQLKLKVLFFLWGLLAMQYGFTVL